MMNQSIPKYEYTGHIRLTKYTHQKNVAVTAAAIDRTNGRLQNLMTEHVPGSRRWAPSSAVVLMMMFNTSSANREVKITIENRTINSVTNAAMIFLISSHMSDKMILKSSSQHVVFNIVVKSMSLFCLMMLTIRLLLN
jgi:hypothetical protein